LQGPKNLTLVGSLLLAALVLLAFFSRLLALLARLRLLTALLAALPGLLVLLAAFAGLLVRLALVRILGHDVSLMLGPLTT
jgi:hypothetical protein